MNKQAVLYKLATLRLAINHVLRNRLIKQADTFPMDGSPTPTMDPYATNQRSMDTIMNQGAKTVPYYNRGSNPLTVPNYTFPQEQIAPSVDLKDKALGYTVLKALNYDETAPYETTHRYWQVDPSADLSYLKLQNIGYGNNRLYNLLDSEGKPENPINKVDTSLYPRVNLMSFLLSKGFPKAAPFTTNYQLTPAQSSSMSTPRRNVMYSNIVRPGDFNLQSGGNLNIAGHEIGHSIREKPRRFLQPGTSGKAELLTDNIDQLFREGGASLVQLEGMRRALKERPDLYDRYKRQAMQTLIPAFSTYVTSNTPNVARELAGMYGGTKNALTGFLTPKGRSLSGWNKNYLNGNYKTQVALKPITDSVARAVGYPLNTLANKWLDSVLANPKNIEEDNKLYRDLADYTKEWYGFDSENTQQVPKKNMTDEEIFNMALTAPWGSLYHANKIFDNLHKNEPGYRKWLSGWREGLGGDNFDIASIPNFDEQLVQSAYAQQVLPGLYKQLADTLDDGINLYKKWVAEEPDKWNSRLEEALKEKQDVLNGIPKRFYSTSPEQLALIEEILKWTNGNREDWLYENKE